jgi:MerR family redox-sensitive transcriptional activator SoxR
MADEVRRPMIGEVARQAGMRTSRIRFQESRGVLPPPERVCGMRRESPDVVRRLAIIDVAQRVGFTLGEIREPFVSDHGFAHQRPRRLAERKLRDVDELIQCANAVRRWLEMTSTCECKSLDVRSRFDDPVPGSNQRTASARSQSVLIIAPGR